MSLSTVSIRRPVLSMVLSIVIIVLGYLGYTFLGVREYPNVDPPIVTVSVGYPGANSDIIESQITEPLEESINGIAGIRSLTSVSRDGRSNITVEFTLETDMEAAANDVRDRVARAQSQLPPDADPPTVAKADADANPILFINFLSETRPLLELSAMANNLVKERMQTIPGVSNVQIWGEKRYAMRLWLDPVKMATRGVTPAEVRSALSSENIELPSGRIEGANTEMTVRTRGRFITVEEFNAMIIKSTGGTLVRLSDIGYAQMGAENEYSILKREGVPMVGVVLIPQPGSNHIQITDAAYKLLEQIKRDIPKDVEVGIGFDTTEFIRKSISEVEETIFIALALVIAIIFLFLRDWRTTLIPILAIPVSLIGAFFIMYLMGFTINVLTLLGLVLAIGIVVDDAIVVMENIFQKIEEGMKPTEAAMAGSTEIFFAVVSTTITLAAVFLPIIFLEGLTGRLFREFGIVIAGAVLISAFVALTLTPMMSARFLKPHTKENKFYHATEPFFVWLNNLYSGSLDFFLKNRYLAFVIMVFALGAVFVIAPMLPTELAPLEDRSALRVSATTSEGTSYEYTSNFIDMLEDTVSAKVPERSVLISGVALGPAGGSNNSGFIRLMLSEPQDRKRSQMEISNYLAQATGKFSDARVFVLQDQTIGTSRGGLPIQYVLLAPTLEKLKEVLPGFIEDARKDATFQQVDVNLKFTKPELVIDIDRAKARDAGVSVADIAQTMQLLLSGQRYGYFVYEGKQYQIIGQVLKGGRATPEDVAGLFVKSRNGEMLRLDNFVKISEQGNSPQLYRYNRYVSATVSASLAPGKTIGDGITAMDVIAEKRLDESFSTALSGASKDFKESSSSLLFTFVLALVFIFLVLAAQFESFRDPLIIMFTVPLALGGAFISLWLFDQTINVFSEIGMIMLIGLVTKNGILIVEFANQKKEQGLPVKQAAREAALMRFRPILMTSLSTILGSLPIALALGAGSESRVSMGIVVVAGMSFSTILTLYVIPALYTFFSKDAKVEGKENKVNEVVV